MTEPDSSYETSRRLQTFSARRQNVGWRGVFGFVAVVAILLAAVTLVVRGLWRLFY